MTKHYSSKLLAKYGFINKDQWHDDYDYVMLTHKTGLTLIHIINPVSVEFNITIATNGGRLYEDQLNLPVGTAHFTEHLICNPNSRFKTDVDLRNYKLGTKSSPSIATNAFTSRYNLGLVADGHASSAIKNLNFLNWQINYPVKRFAEFFEKEKNIILAEQARSKPELKDADQVYRNLLFKGKAYIHPTIGSKESIQSIQLDHVQLFWQHLFACPETIICIQSGAEFTNSEWDGIDKITQSLQAKNAKGFNKIVEPDLNTPTYLGYFTEPSRQNTLVMTETLSEFLPYKEVYRKFSGNLARNLFNRLANQHLREEKSLVYSVSSGKGHITNVKMITTTSGEFEGGIDKLNSYLTELEYVIYKLMPDFVNQPIANSWLTAQISNVIFPVTPNYKSNLDTSVAVDYLRFKDIKFNEKEYNKIVKAFTIKDLDLAVQEFVQAKKWLWIETHLPEAEVEQVIKNSEIYKLNEAKV